MNDFNLLRDALNTESDSQIIEIQNDLMNADRERTDKFIREAYELCRLVVHSVPLSGHESGYKRNNALNRLEESLNWAVEIDKE